MNGPIACLYRVSIGFKDRDDDDRPVLPTGACRSVTVVAKNAETAIARARAHLGSELGEGERTCVISVELVEGIDVP